MSTDRPGRGAGFTLLEVIVALAIAGLALVGLFAAGSGSMFAADIAARSDEAVERAQSHLAAIGRDAAPVAGDRDGDDGGGYRWHLRVRPVSSRPLAAPLGVPPTLLMLYDVEVAVSWRTQGHEHRVVLQTMRLGTAAPPR